MWKNFHFNKNNCLYLLLKHLWLFSNQTIQSTHFCFCFLQSFELYIICVFPSRVNYSSIPVNITQYSLKKVRYKQYIWCFVIMHIRWLGDSGAYSYIYLLWAITYYKQFSLIWRLSWVKRYLIVIHPKQTNLVCVLYFKLIWPLSSSISCSP